jgi:hypothetical protein
MQLAFCNTANTAERTSTYFNGRFDGASGKINKRHRLPLPIQECSAIPLPRVARLKLVRQSLLEPNATLSHLIVKVPEAKDGLLLDLTEDGEKGGLHSVTVERVLPRLQDSIHLQSSGNTFSPNTAR